MVRVCVAKNCKNTSNSTPKRSFFKFPKDPECAKKWIAVSIDVVSQTNVEHIGSPYSKFAICDVHFEKCMYNTRAKNRLVSKAVPTIFPECDGYNSETIDDAEDVSHITEQEITIKEEPIDDESYLPVIKVECTLDQDPLVQQMKCSSLEIVPEQGDTFGSNTSSSVQVKCDGNFLSNEAVESKLSSNLKTWNKNEFNKIVQCRTCLLPIDPVKSAPLYDKCHPKKTIKEMIQFCVPHKMLTLTDEDFICSKCLKSVRLSVKFIEDFLKVEKMLNESRTVREIEFVEVPTIPFKIDEDINIEQTELMIISSDDESITTLPEIGDHLIKREKSPCDDSITSSNENERKVHGIERAGGYDCHICDLHFTELKEMESHWLQHTSHCSRCQKRFPEEKIGKHFEHCKGVQGYEKSSVEKSPVKYVEDVNSSMSDYVDRHKLASKGTAFLCHLCGCSLPLASDLEVHLRLHADSNIFLCDMCPKAFKKFRLLKYHKMYTHRRFKSECKYCGRMMWNYTMSHHYKSFHSKEIKYFCKICGEDFMKIDLYKSHLRSHLLMGHVKHPNKKKSDPFNKAEKKEIAKKLKQFDTNCHLSRVKCKVCFVTFSSSRARDEHQKIHEDPSHSNRCDICLEVYKSQDELKEHVARHIQYTCSYCEQRFTERNSLYQHILEDHPEFRM
ncbi:hypothetical protein JTB14_021301 [Gonioctena quinquepunctata]|nr:hypothetical protein JTB14_021301 [Gonioctena quinquepunctata]